MKVVVVDLEETAFARQEFGKHVLLSNEYTKTTQKIPRPIVLLLLPIHVLGGGGRVCRAAACFACSEKQEESYEITLLPVFKPPSPESLNNGA
jgi:hypothetical protein